MIFRPKGHFCIHFTRHLKLCDCDLKVTANKPGPLPEQCVLWRYDGGVGCLSRWTSVPAGPCPSDHVGHPDPHGKPGLLSGSALFTWVELGAPGPAPTCTSTVGCVGGGSWGAIAVPATKTYKELQC